MKTKPRPKRKFRSANKSLSQLLAQLSAYEWSGQCGKIPSCTSREERARTGYRAIQILHDNGFIIEDIRRLRTKHVMAIYRHWRRKGLSESCIDMELCRLRAITEFMGKNGLIPSRATLEEIFVSQETSTGET